MTREILLAFEDIIHGTANVYSSSFVELRLAESEAYAIQAVVEGISGVENTTVQLETSGDGRNWVSKNPTPEINAVSTPAGQVTATYGYDAGNFPALALVRLRIALGGAAPPTARVRVYVRQTPGNYVLPSRLPGCLLWLRSDLGVTFGSGTAVSNWADQSGNGNDASQSTSTQQPIWTPNSVNGLPTLNFDGVNDVLATAGSTLGTYTVMMVATGQLATNTGYFWWRGTATVAADTFYGSTGATMYTTRSGTTSTYDYTANWGQYGTSTAKVLVVQFDGTHAGHTLRINASPISLTSGLAGDPGTGTTSDKFCVGARDDGSFAGSPKVAEVAVFNTALPPFAVNALEEYARRRYLLF